jgi:hypothetical protein
MSEQVKNFIDKLSLGQAAEAGEAFKDALRDKVGSALEDRRKELASTLFQGKLDVTSFSDPKPEVISPSSKTVPDSMVNNGEQVK